MFQRASTLPTGVPKVRFSFKHHFLPPFLGIVFSLLIYGALNYPAYLAQIRYELPSINLSHKTSQAITAAPTSDDSTQLLIPTIGVDAPVIYEPKANNSVIAYDLRSGLVHYGTTAFPGEQGKVVIVGHSSGAAWAPGKYKFVFTLLNKLQPGQQVALNYRGTRYVYQITYSEVVTPTTMSALASNGTKSELELITCSPVGTSKNRLLVHATQLYPDPSTNKADTHTVQTVANELPGN